MSTRKFLTASSVATVILGWGVVAARSAPQGAPAAQPIKLQRCKILWADERIISSKIPGRIDRRLVDDGDLVDAGKPLAELDAREVKAEYDIQQKIADSELAIEVAKAKLEEYYTRREASRPLYEKRAISEEDWRLANVNVLVNKLQTDQEIEKRAIEQLKAERTKVILDDHTISSPMKALVQKCFRREKESVPANDLQMFRLVAIDKVWVEGFVPESDWYSVRKGQAVRVQIKFLDDDGKRIDVPQADLKFDGRIVFKDPDVDGVSRVFLVRAEVPNQFDPTTGDPILVAGLKAEMEIVMGQPVPQAKAPAKKVAK